MSKPADILDTLRTARATLKARTTEAASARTAYQRAKVTADKAHAALTDARKAYDAALAGALEAFPESSKL